MSFIGDALGLTKRAAAPPVQQALPTRADPAVAEAARREAVASGKIRGAGANLLVGSAYGDTSAPSVAKKVLTGQ